MTRFKEHLAARNDTLSNFGRPLLAEHEQISLDMFEEKLELARCPGRKDFDSVYEAVFDFDDFHVAAGAPDLLVWVPERKFWFFAEVKGPHDHLRRSQAEWIGANWEAIRGRYVLLVVPPEAAVKIG